jgi:hypothetical protein
MIRGQQINVTLSVVSPQIASIANCAESFTRFRDLRFKGECFSAGGPLKPDFGLSGALAQACGLWAFEPPPKSAVPRFMVFEASASQA